MGSQLTRGPIVGSIIVVLAGVVIAIVPFQFQKLLSVIGGGNTTVGLLLGGGIVLCGIGAFLKPDFSTELGIVTMALSVLSLFGAFGGLLVGLILGIIGSNMLLAWKPNS